MVLPRSDVYALIGSAIGLMVLVTIGEALRQQGWSRRASRRVVHAGVGVFVAFTPDFFAGPTAVYLLAIGFVIGNAWTLRRGLLKGMHAPSDESWGTVLFPLALLPALYFCWTLQPDRQFALRVAFLILAFADPLAAWAGGTFGKRRLFGRQAPPKSIVGSATFATGALVISLSALGALKNAGAIDWTWMEAAAAAISVSLLTTAVEALGRHGWDNFYIVIAAICTLVVFDEQAALRTWIIGGIGAGALFGGIAWRAGALDRAGALAAALLAVTLVVGGWRWAVPGVVFFVLSSALSRVGKQRKQSIQQYEKSKTARDAAQVYANGGVAWGLLVVYLMVPWEGLYWGFLGAFATAAADTWATELGALSPDEPRSLRTGRKVPRGTSGAVSWVGSLATVAGAVSVVGSAALVNDFGAGFSVALSVLVGCGWLGAFVDSLVGATVQAQYFDAETGVLHETRSGASARPAQGWRAITNDRVNWIGTSSGALGAMIAYFVLGG